MQNPDIHDLYPPLGDHPGIKLPSLDSEGSNSSVPKLDGFRASVPQLGPGPTTGSKPRSTTDASAGFGDNGYIRCVTDSDCVTEHCSDCGSEHCSTKHGFCFCFRTGHFCKASGPGPSTGSKVKPKTDAPTTASPVSNGLIKCVTDSDCVTEHCSGCGSEYCPKKHGFCFCLQTGRFCNASVIQGPNHVTNHTDHDGGPIHPEDLEHIAGLGRQTEDQSTVVNIVVPLALIVVFSLIISIVCLRRQRKHRLRPKRSAETMVKSSDGVMLLDRMNNINKNPSYFTSLHDEHDDLSRPRRFLAPEICMDHIMLVDVVGEGAFGQVYRGELLWPESNSKQLVAVKVLKENVSIEIREDFEREVEIMSAFDHDNILKLVGVVTQNAGQSPYMIFEYMVHGDLAELLRRNEPFTIQHDNNGIVRLQKPDLVDIATQIANGMRYLTSQHFVHRDLATRNCLVGEGLVVKISDFGMSRDIYTCDYYKIGGSRMLPVRWMSPESVKFGRFTSESDVWAYGVVLWEIFSNGRQPYYGHSNEEVVRFLDAGIMLQRPEDCPSTIYHIMLGCWKADPKERHSFDKIHRHLQDYHERLVKMVAASLPTTPVASKSELRPETPPTTASSPDLLSKSPLVEPCGPGAKLLRDAWSDPQVDCHKGDALAECAKESSALSPEEACLNPCWQTLTQQGVGPVPDLPPKSQKKEDCLNVVFQVKLPPLFPAGEEKGLKNTSLDSCPQLPTVHNADTDGGLKNTFHDSCPHLRPAEQTGEDEDLNNVLHESCPQLSPVQHENEDKGINNTSHDSCPQLSFAQYDEKDEGTNGSSTKSLSQMSPVLYTIEDERVNTSSLDSYPEPAEMTKVQLEAASPADDPDEPLSSVLDLSGVDSGFSSGEQPWSTTDPESTTASPSAETGLESLRPVMCSDPAQVV